MSQLPEDTGAIVDEALKRVQEQERAEREADIERQRSTDQKLAEALASEDETPQR